MAMSESERAVGVLVQLQDWFGVAGDEPKGPGYGSAQQRNPHTRACGMTVTRYLAG